MISVLPPPFVPVIRKGRIVGSIDISGYRSQANDLDNVLKIEGPTPLAGVYILRVFSLITADAPRNTKMLVLLHEDEDYRNLAPVLSLVRDTVEAMRAAQAGLKAKGPSVPADETTH